MNNLSNFYCKDCMVWPQRMFYSYICQKCNKETTDFVGMNDILYCKVSRNSILSGRKIINKAEFKYNVIRKFMNSGLDPNEYYREWLEKYIGFQNKEWDWELMNTDIDLVRIFFRQENDVLLFQLKWH